MHSPNSFPNFHRLRRASALVPFAWAMASAVACSDDAADDGALTGGAGGATAVPPPSPGSSAGGMPPDGVPPGSVSSNPPSPQPEPDLVPPAMPPPTGAAGASGGSPTGGQGPGPSSGGTPDANAGQGGTAPSGAGTGGGAPAAAGAAGSAGGSATTEMEWLPSWATTIQRTEQSNLPPPLGDKTLRQYLWITYSGEQIRLQLSNEKGTAPTEITKVHIAKPGAADGEIDPATDAEFTWQGTAEVTIPAGETVWSDALDYPVVELERMAITIHFTSVPTEITGHPGSRNTSFVGDGDTVAEASLGTTETRDRWYFIDTLEVMAPADAYAVGVLGDSITDGYGVLNTFERWTDFLTLAVKDDPVIADKVSVLNFGMGANSLLNGNGDQDAGRVRFDRDVLGRPKVKWVIVLEGVNDIGGQSNTALVDQITGAYQEMIDKGNEAGIFIYGSPITPFKGNSYDAGEALTIRNQINDWVINSGAFHAVVRLDEAIADPADPDLMLEMYSNDGLHPSTAGYEAMGYAVDTTLFHEIME